MLINQADHEASVVSLGIMNAGSISPVPCSSYLNVKARCDSSRTVDLYDIRD